MALIATHQVVCRQALFAICLIAVADGARAQTDQANSAPIAVTIEQATSPDDLPTPSAEPLPATDERAVATIAEQPVATTGAEQLKRPLRISPPPEHESFPDYLDDTLKSPFPYAYAFAAAVLDHWTGFPSEWTGGSGFARRYAARVGQGIVADAVAHGTAALLNQRITYDRCRCSGVGPRTKHALVRAFVGVRNDGARVPNYPLWISKYSSSGLATAWYPASYTRRDVIVQASTAVVFSAGLNVLREFAHFK